MNISLRISLKKKKNISPRTVAASHICSVHRIGQPSDQERDHSYCRQPKGAKLVSRWDVRCRSRRFLLSFLFSWLKSDAPTYTDMEWISGTETNPFSAVARSIAFPFSPHRSSEWGSFHFLLIRLIPAAHACIRFGSCSGPARGHAKHCPSRVCLRLRTRRLQAALFYWVLTRQIELKKWVTDPRRNIRLREKETYVIQTLFLKRVIYVFFRSTG